MIFRRFFWSGLPGWPISRSGRGGCAGSEGRSIRILVFGDSNTARPHLGGTRWTDLLQAFLGCGFVVLNEGRDGRTAGLDFGEANGLLSLPPALSAHAPVDWLLLMLGTNDQKSGYGPPPPRDIVEALDALVTLALEACPHTGVMLLTPPPMGRVRGGELRYAHAGLAETAKGIRRLADRRRFPLVDLHAALNPRRHLERDGVHLNEKGRGAVARAVLPVLSQALVPS